MPYQDMITGYVVLEQRANGLFPIAVVSTKEKAIERAMMTIKKPLFVPGDDPNDAPIRFALPAYMFFPENAFNPIE